MEAEARLSLTAWTPASVPRKLLAASGLDLEALRAATQGWLRWTPSWKAGHVRVQPGSVIGSQRLGRLRIDVAPRMAAGELATMIREAWGARDLTVRRTAARLERSGLDELLGRLLADEATALRQRGVVKRYERRQERLGVVRGRPAFAANFPWRSGGMTSLVCTHHLLTTDTLANRLVRAALERAVLLDVSPSTRQSLSAHRAAWEHLAGPMHPTPADFAEARTRRDRLSAHYALAHHLGEVLVRGARPSGLFEAGSATAGFTLDMASLFEAFVERRLARWGRPRGITVQAQQPDRGAFVDAEGAVYRRVRPDLVLYRGGMPVGVVDAKYKAYWPAKRGRPKRRVSTADLYQLFFYAQRLQAQYGLAQAPAAFIVAPVPAADERNSPVIRERYQRIAWRAGGEAGHAHLVLLPLTDLLRGDVGAGWTAAIVNALGLGDEPRDPA